MPVRPLALITLVLGLIAPAASNAQCEPALDAESKAIATPFGVDKQHAQNLETAFRAIVAAADYRSGLLICVLGGPNAFAMQTEHGPMVGMSVELIKLLDGNVEEMAAVISHELGHLVHNHMARQMENLVRVRDEEIRRAQQKVKRGQDVRAVVFDARRAVFSQVAAFSRESEREADDQGFAFMRIAGYDMAAVGRAYDKMRKVYGGTAQGWLSTHPGWDERVANHARLEENERFRAKAESLLEKKQLSALRALIDEWSKALPDSGAAKFYQGMYLLARGEPRNKSAPIFEDAVSLFAGDGLSRAAQSYQNEGYLNTIALCVSLYREDKVAETLSCLALLETFEEIELFKQVTGWRHFIIPPPRIQRHGPIFAGRTEGETVTITNCRHIADREGLREVKPWKAIRPATAKAAAAPGTTSLACSRNLCNCEPLELEKIFPALAK